MKKMFFLLILVAFLMVSPALAQQSQSSQVDTSSSTQVDTSSSTQVDTSSSTATQSQVEQGQSQGQSDMEDYSETSARQGNK